MASSRSSVLSEEAPPKGRVGSELPRVWTPPLRKLTRGTSAGFECIEFAEGVLGVTLLPWQRWLLIHALELLPDGSYRFRTVVLLVARQNGKSTIMQVLALWRMYVDGAPLVIGTAQNLDVAEEQWQACVDMAQSVPELAAEIPVPGGVVKVNGKKCLRLTTGERYKVAAASRRGGRGLSGDLILLDELREHQTWHAWGAVTKTTMARLRAQVWAASNAGDAASVVLAFLRMLAHAELGNPDGLDLGETPPEAEDEEADSLGIFEWSAPPGCDVWDRDAWAMANPSLGHTITERAIASAARTDPEAVFRTEVLCQWVDNLAPQVIPAVSWLACRSPKSGPVGTLGFALDVTPNRDASCFAVVTESGLGGYHLEITSDVDSEPDHRPGTAWVAPRAEELYRRWGKPFGVVKNSPAWALVEEAGDEANESYRIKGTKVPVFPIEVSELAQACGLLYDAVVDGEAHHLDTPELNTAVAGAAKRDYGDAWLWSRRKSSADISPLVAVTAALWVHTQGDDFDPAASVW